MPDLNIEIFPVCSQLEPYKHRWNVGGYEQNVNHFYEIECTCKGYQFRKTCKHAKQVDEERCTWHGAYDEPMTEKNACPRCGNPVIYVRVGV